jgi:hypothetical protein
MEIYKFKYIENIRYYVLSRDNESQLVLRRLTPAHPICQRRLRSAGPKTFKGLAFRDEVGNIFSTSIKRFHLVDSPLLGIHQAARPEARE